MLSNTRSFDRSVFRITTERSQNEAEIKLSSSKLKKIVDHFRNIDTFLSWISKIDGRASEQTLAQFRGWIFVWEFISPSTLPRRRRRRRREPGHSVIVAIVGYCG